LLATQLCKKDTYTAQSPLKLNTSKEKIEKEKYGADKIVCRVFFPER
jgi:hypothetical protein